MSNFLNRGSINWLFIDWFGVLSSNFYWCIQSKMSEELKNWCSCVFDDNEVLNDWMRGKYDLKYLTDFRFKIDQDFVVEAFLSDMKYYEPDFHLLDILNSLFPKAKKVLVTDNIALFSHIVENYDLKSFFYKMYLSYEVGLLKNDNPDSLFDFILKDLDLKNFQNCLLIDDNQSNCQNFNYKGGRTILIS